MRLVMAAFGAEEISAAVGDRVSLVDTDGQALEVTVVGTLDPDLLEANVYASHEVSRVLDGSEPVVSSFHVGIEPGADADEVARRLNAELVAKGVEAESVSRLVRDAFAQQDGFLSLLRGYLGVGLVIGIAGLGVVMVRAVRERRRVIGTLRAVGVSAMQVRRAFLVEAAFITLPGVLIGVGTGVLSSWQLLSASTVFAENGLDYRLPWLAIAVVAAIAVSASLAATSFPARRAAAIRPAVALRVAD